MSSYSQIIVTPESLFFPRWVSLYGKDKRFTKDALQLFLEQLHGWDRVQNYHFDSAEFDTCLHETDETVSLANVFDAMMTYYAEKEGKAIWCEKTPYNEFFLREIRAWYPTAKLIYIVRDPGSVISSLLNTPWASKNIYKNIVEWKQSTRIFKKNREDFVFIRYEDLVDEPTRTVATFCENLEINFEDNMLQQRDASIKEKRDGWAKEALEKDTGKIDSQNKEKWRKNLTPSQVGGIEW